MVNLLWKEIERKKKQDRWKSIRNKMCKDENKSEIKCSKYLKKMLKI